MFIKIIRLSFLSLILFSPLHSVKAVEALSTAELASHCEHYKDKPDGVDAVFCIRYIQGFIDGAIATDEKVAQNAIAQSDGTETFSERAIRLRKARQKRNDPTYYAEFCLGTPVPLKSIVEKIIVNFNNRKYNSKEVPARDAVYFILRNEYPCEK